MEKQRMPEGAEIRSEPKLDKAKALASQNPKALAAAIKADPKAEGVFSRIAGGAWKGVVSWGASAWEGTKAAFVWTGEFIGVGIAKLQLEGTDSFLDYAADKTSGIRNVVNIAGEAIAITAFEAVHGDRSVVADAVAYWKEKGVKFSNMPAERQAELVSSFATQVAIGVLGSKGLGAVSKTATAAITIDAVGSAARAGAEVSAAAAKSAQALRAAGKLGRAATLEASGSAVEHTVAAVWKSAEKVVKAGAKLWVTAAGLDTSAFAKEKPKTRVHAASEAANDEMFQAEKLRANGASPSVRTESASPRVSIRPGTPEYDAYRKEAVKHGIHVAESKPAAAAKSADSLPHKPSEPIDLAVERLARSTQKIEGARQLAEQRLLSWEPVFVKRTNGGISVGRVTRIGEDGRIDVAFSGKNGASLHKTLDPLEFRRLNDSGVRLAPEIGREQIRMRDRMMASAERTGQSVEAASSEVFRNAALGPAERVASASIELKLGRELSQTETSALLKAHSVKAEGESAFNFGTKSLGKKMKILQVEGGFSNEQAKILVRKGYAGEVSVSAERVTEIKKLVKSGDYASQSEFLAKSSPQEIGHAFNNGLTDYAAEAFEPEFLHATDRAVTLFEKNSSNIAGVSKELKALVDGLPASVPADQKKLLSGIVDKMTVSGWASFKESFAKAASGSELQSIVKSLPESVSMREGMDAFKEAVSKLGVKWTAGADVAHAIDAFAQKFPASAKESAMLMVEKVSPEHWKNANVFKSELWFSVNGDEFRPLLKKLARENPEKVTAIANGAWTEGNFQLQGLQRAAALERPFSLNAFRDSFSAASPTERLSMLLWEHADTKLLNVREISQRVGADNLDRFFHLEDLQTLIAKSHSQPDLTDKVKRLLNHYGRDESWYTREFLANHAIE